MNHSTREEAIRKAGEFLAHEPVYLDTETTGTGPNDNILEIAIVNHDGEVLIDTLVRPVGAINPEAEAVHGISLKMVKDAPKWQEVWQEVEVVLQNRWVGIYNADFDLRMIQQSHSRNWMNWSRPVGMQEFCIMKLYAQYIGQWNPRRGGYRWHSLDAAGRQSGIPLPNSHRAKDDALLTRAVLEYVTRRKTP
jgi:DNA polymerase III epsilon subunit-like protein